VRTLVHLSDLHFGRIDRSLVEPLRRAVTDAQPDLTVISGDFTQRARRSQFASAQAFLQSLQMKTLVVPGNHDIPLFDIVERFAAPLTRYRQFISVALEPEYEDDEMIVIGVNTARALVFPFGEGRINERQVGRIVQRLSGVAPAKLRVIVTHHPFDLPPGVHERRLLGRSAAAMSKLAAANADLFLSGHLHISHVSHAVDRYEIEGHSALIVQAGTVSTRSRGEQPSFNVLRIQRPNIELMRCSWDDVAGTFVSSTVGRYRHTDRGWLADDPGEQANGPTGERANGRTGERANRRTGEQANGVRGT
jgi:3',5'-cyclic AMP phosphodiesterase CpdA